METEINHDLVRRFRFVLGLFYDSLLAIDAFHTSCQSKVTNLYRAVIVHQNIAWLQITMDDFSLMQIIKSTENVIDDGLNLSLLQVLSRLDQLLEVHITLAKDKIYLVESKLVKWRFSLALDISGWNDT